MLVLSASPLLLSLVRLSVWEVLIFLANSFFTKLWQKVLFLKNSSEQQWHCAQHLATPRLAYCKTTARPLGHHVLYCRFWVMLSFWPVYLAQKSCNLVISVLTCGAVPGTLWPWVLLPHGSGGSCSIEINSPCWINLFYLSCQWGPRRYHTNDF